ncbi:lipopolysaccharide biosynthesis protein [uncultured Bacteroides sp.]|uniref:lipopolysaccharide biosynthesis protein n=1 Tax=uncultured Bacteroides sp. TaxID=162156 RepID=UPI00262CCC94|nr:lipopolysaccharide biosynthesis protein [uncultured Bacteroides sp.]
MKRDIASGVLYIAIAKYSSMALQLIVTAILARILCPSDYGAIAIVTVFINFFNILGDIGIGPAIIQNKKLDEEDLENIFSTTIYMGVLLSIIFAGSASLLSNYYDNDILFEICLWLSLLILAYCSNIVPQNLLYKEKRFKLISISSLCINILTGSASVATAYMGWGIYALVLSQLLSAFATTLFFYSRKRIRFRIIPNPLALKKIMSFSIFQFLFNLVNYFGRNADKMLVGRYLGMTELGYYEKSYRLMMLPLQNITFVISPVLLPVFSTLQDNPREVGDKYFNMLKILSYVAFPLSVILYFCSAELVLCFFGDQWYGAIHPFKILTLTVGLQILTSTTGAIFQSINKTKQMFYAGACGALFMIVSFIITLNVWGTTESVAYGYLVAQLLNTVQCFYLIAHSLCYRLGDILICLWKSMVGSVLLAAVYYLYVNYISVDDLFMSLITKGLFGVLITLIIIQILGDINLIQIAKTMFKNNATIR